MFFLASKFSLRTGRKFCQEVAILISFQTGRASPSDYYHIVGTLDQSKTISSWHSFFDWNSTYLSMFLWSMRFITSVSSRAFRSVRFITIPVSLHKGTVQRCCDHCCEHFNLLYCPAGFSAVRFINIPLCLLKEYLSKFLTNQELGLKIS